MSVSTDRWTCPECEVTELADDSIVSFDAWRDAAQTGHAARHEAERGKAGPLASALLDATEIIAGFRVRLVVAPGDLGRVRAMVVRRSLPVEVFADSALAVGDGYVMTPRRGVRELHRLRSSTSGDNPGDGAS